MAKVNVNRGKLFRSKEEKAYNAEVDKQYEIVYGAAVIILRELHRWTDARIDRMLGEADRAWKEINTGPNMMDVFRVLEKETGIVMELKGKKYKDVDVFQDGWVEHCKTLGTYNYTLTATMPWIASGFMAGLMIALHRSEGWENEKGLFEFMSDMKGVMYEWKSASRYRELLEKNYNMTFELRE